MSCGRTVMQCASSMTSRLSCLFLCAVRMIGIHFDLSPVMDSGVMYIMRLRGWPILNWFFICSLAWTDGPSNAAASQGSSHP